VRHSQGEYEAASEGLLTISSTGSDRALEEYRVAYEDGRVTAFLAVPELPTPFYIQLTSSGYIAPGLAMFVCEC
jgi:hypothetical protein